MSTWIKRGLLTVAVFLVTWVMFITYWSGANHMPDGGDVILYLLVLPAVFLLLVWGIAKGRSAMAAAAAAKAAAAAAAPPPAAAVTEPGHSPERKWTLAIVATALRSPFGADATDLLEQIKSQSLRLPLDGELVNDQGMPILAGRISDVQGEETREIYQAWQRQHFPEQALTPQDNSHWRSLALAADIARELGDRLQWHPLLEEYQDAPRHRQEEVGLPHLHLLVLLPPTWSSEQRMQAARWLGEQVCQQGWPPEKLNVLPAAAGENAHPLLHLDRLVATSRDPRTQQPSPYLASSYLAMVIAAQSNLDPEIVQAWQQDKQLLQGAQSIGKSPAEAAAGLILADTTQALAMGTADPVLLHRASLGRHEQSVDQARRVPGDLLIQLAQGALRDAAIVPDQLALLVSDGDYRASRTDEIMKLGYAVLPELDLGSQCVKLGASCGSAGLATALSALVLAHAATDDSDQPSLCVCNEDAHQRAVVALSRAPAIAAAPAPVSDSAASTATPASPVTASATV
ncbi:hypothetical protein [Herbaspirillum huttiense]|uniref:Uncharacterized protein n=3 Tax=Pseudomonadota TaxID=1224 RepID=A0AAJ2H6M3_9BURK|nr:hypothetical protein [Herbaspirillum huttiense]MDR9836558.1 hypothetical protein [Herbaspirillum huttiense]